MMNFQEHSWVRLALGMACCFSASCNGDDEQGSGRGRELFAATHSAINAACACNPDQPCGYIPAYECAGPTVERHEDELSDWIDCSLAAYGELQTCIDDSDCTADALAACFSHHSPGEVCEPIPEALDDQIDDELEVECPEPVDCDDGSTATGDTCDGHADCADASDEEGCGDDPLAGQR